MSLKTVKANADFKGSWQELFVPSCSERVLKAKKRVLTDMELCLERSRAYKKALLAYPDAPRVIQRAHMFETYLRDKSVVILEDELLVGNVCSKVRGASFAPEHVFFTEKELDDPEKDFCVRPLDPVLMTEEERRELKEDLIPFFKGKTVADQVYGIADQEVKDKAYLETALDVHIPILADFSIYKDVGHQLINYEKVLYKGLNGIKAEVQQYLEEAKAPYNRYRRQEKIDFYEAMLITLNAAIDYTKRYAALAREMAEKETDPRRKQELLQIAETCEQVPANPARDWREALQSYWFTHMLVLCDTWLIVYGMGRFDQFLYPFYKKSVLEDKTMTEEEALELMECLFVKINEWAYLLAYDVVIQTPGQALSQTITIGGRKSDGSDACNEVTNVVLEAMEQVGLPQPDVAMRVWEETPEKYLIKAAEVIRWGHGPKIISDKTGVEMMTKRYPDLTPGDLEDFVIMGCTETALPHITMQNTWEGAMHAPKILELVLTNGKCAICQKQIGPVTGDPRTFRSMADVQKAYLKQQDYWTDLLFRGIKYIKEVQSTMQHIPFCSSLVDGPMQKGRDLVEGGAWYTTNGVSLVGLADTADSLSVIDKLIFRDKSVSWDELLTALQNNWEGYEELRQKCVNSVPKFGNDDDFADTWAVWVADAWNDAVDKANDTKKYTPSTTPDARYVSAGMVGQYNVGAGNGIYAMPNGRAYPKPIAENFSPYPGVDLNGPTAVAKSMSKLPWARFDMGGLFNLRLNAQMLTDDDDVKRLAAFLRSVADLGCYQVQFNVISTDLLRRAQKVPEEHRDLLIRVASYMSYFVELTEDMQNDIINRTEHGIW